MAITRTAKGTAASKSSGTTLTISSVSIEAGAVLVVGIAWEDDNPGETPTLKIGNRDLTFVVDSHLKQGDTIVRIYKTRVKASKAKDITAVWPTALTARAMFATQIKEASAKDVQSTNGNASGTNPTTGTAVTSTIADTISIAAFACLGPTSDTAATAGAGHTIGQRIGTTGGAAASNITLQETYEILSATGNVRSTLTLTTARVCAASIVAFAPTQTYTLVGVEQYHRTQNENADWVVTTIEDESGRGFQIRIDPEKFDDMSDAEYKEALKELCGVHADNIIDGLDVTDVDSARDTRMSGFVDDEVII